MGADALHSLLSPSKRHRWGVCPGSIREEAKYPEQEAGPTALDGTRTHTVLEWAINHEFRDGKGPLNLVAARDETVTDEYGPFTLNEDRLARVAVALEYIRSRVNERPNARRVIAETRVFPDGLVGRADLHGTIDVQIVDPDVYEIVDYKDGVAFVDAVENPQLILYAVGVLAGLEKAPKSFQLTIIQPKNAIKGMPVISTWNVSTKGLLEQHVPRIIREAAATDDPNAPLVPGEAQCKYCRAKATCPALTGMVTAMFGPVPPIEPTRAAPVFTSYTHRPGDRECPCNECDHLRSHPSTDVATSAANKEPEGMSDEELRKFLDAAPLVRNLLDAIDKEALRRLEAGKPVPGYKLVRGRGSRDWNLSEEEMVKKLGPGGMNIPKGSLYVSKLISPAQAEKLTWESKGEQKSLSKKQIENMNKEYVTQRDGKPTVVPESDSRPAIVVDASSMFEAIATVAEPVTTVTVEHSIPLPPWLVVPEEPSVPAWMR